MSPKQKKHSSSWFCTACGHESIQYLGRCPHCGEWSSFREAPKAEQKKQQSSTDKYLAGASADTAAVRLAEVDSTDAQRRISTGMSELDRVLGGGLCEGTFMLIGGDPGIGKSTLLLQAMGNIVSQGRRVLYASGEESAHQVRNRAIRLGVDLSLLFCGSTSLEDILDQIAHTQPELVVIDSIQAMQMSGGDGFPGSPSQIRNCGNTLLKLAKQTGTTVIIVGHITKDGTIAGPKLLEHMVDVVLHFEGDKQNYFRVLRATKNRFGSTEELGLFEMTSDGLHQISNPSSIFVKFGQREATGTAITPVVHGSRVMLVEIQALVAPTHYAQPRHSVTGLDYNRTNQIAAILERRLGLPLSKQDIYANIVGGIDIDEPSTDLALAMAIVSCLRNRRIRDNLIVCGEVGLTGETRQIARLEARLREAVRLGFTEAVVPATAKLPDIPGMSVHHIERISEALPLVMM